MQKEKPKLDTLSCHKKHLNKTTLDIYQVYFLPLLNHLPLYADVTLCNKQRKMPYKNTVAIISATTAVGAVIAKSIAANYCLLLMDEAQSKLSLLQNEIQAMDKNAEVDILNCCKNASWEADIIVVANDGENLDELAVKMKEVSNRKIVLHFTSGENNIDKLQQFLPHAKVVTIILSQPFTDTGANANAFIRGLDKEAVDTAKMMVAAIACTPNRQKRL